MLGRFSVRWWRHDPGSVGECGFAGGGHGADSLFWHPAHAASVARVVWPQGMGSHSVTMYAGVPPHREAT
mgnify:FL=1